MPYAPTEYGTDDNGEYEVIKVVLAVRWYPHNQAHPEEWEWDHMVNPRRLEAGGMLNEVRVEVGPDEA